MKNLIRKDVLNIIVVALITQTLCSCDWLYGVGNAVIGGHDDDVTAYMSNYNIAVNFKDATGKDLVKGIELSESTEEATSGEVKPEAYTCDVNVQYTCLAMCLKDTKWTLLHCRSKEMTMVGVI